VWQALLDLGISYQIVTGSSVGALNGALMVQQDFPLAKDMWESVTDKDIMLESGDLSSRQKLLMTTLKKIFERGGLDVSPLESTVRRVVDEAAVRASSIDFGIITVKFPTFQQLHLVKDEIPQGELVDYLLASAAYFPLFPRKEIGGDQFIDGAYSDNMPAKLALELGAEEIIAIDLDSYGIVRPLRTDVPVTYIRCHWDLGELMVFDTAAARRNITLGRQDGLKAFHKLEGTAYAFVNGESRRNAQSLSPALDDIRRQTGVHLFKEYWRLAKRQDAQLQRPLFVRPGSRHYSLGRAITTAAEITGELLEVAPDITYTFPAFNNQILERAAYLPAPSPLLSTSRPEETRHSLFSLPRIQKSHQALHAIYRHLESAYFTGHAPEAMWGMAALSPREFVAANYILALKLDRGRR